MTFLGVAWNGSRQSMQDFVDRHGLTFPSLVDIDGEVFGRYNVPSQPAWAFIDDQGQATTVLGSLSASTLEGYVSQLVESVN